MSRIRRAEDTLSASRNKVSNRRVVGKTLNSTGFVMYIATISTMTDIMMSQTINKSSRMLGIGAINAITIPSTAAGTANSLIALSEIFGAAVRDFATVAVI